MPLLADEAKESRLLSFWQSGLRVPWKDEKSGEAGSKLSPEGLGVGVGADLTPIPALNHPDLPKKISWAQPGSQSREHARDQLTSHFTTKDAEAMEQKRKSQAL